MSMPFVDNIDYQGRKPDFTRQEYATLADMKAVKTTKMSEMYIGYCLATRKVYLYDKNNEEDETLGKWREFNAGGEGQTIQVNSLPTAGASELNKIYQYIGATDTYINGYFYKCVGEGDPIVYSWVQCNTQPSGGSVDSVNGYTGVVNLNATDVGALPDDTSLFDGDYNSLTNKPTLGTASSKGSTDLIRPNSHDLVESGAVYNAINQALDSIYTPRGDLTCAELTSALLIEANVGSVYQMSDAGTTTALFIQGAGHTISVNDNVGIVKAGQNTYLFNLMGNAFDLHEYQKKELTDPLTIDGQSQTEVEGALSALNNSTVKESNATTKTFYIDYVNGSDTNDGLSDITAFKTVDPVKSIKFAGIINLRFCSNYDGDVNLRDLPCINGITIRSVDTSNRVTINGQILIERKNNVSITNINVNFSVNNQSVDSGHGIYLTYCNTAYMSNVNLVMNNPLSATAGAGIEYSYVSHGIIGNGVNVSVDQQTVGTIQFGIVAYNATVNITSGVTVTGTQTCLILNQGSTVNATSTGLTNWTCTGPNKILLHSGDSNEFYVDNILQNQGTMTKAEMNTYKVEIFVDNVNGNDTNDGLTQQTPWKTIDIDRVRERFGSCRVYYFTLLSDYDVEGHTVRIPRVEGTVRIASNNTTRRKVYSSVTMPSDAILTFLGDAVSLEHLELYDTAEVRVSAFLSVSCTQLYTNNCKFTSVNTLSNCFNCSRVDWFANNLYVDTNVDGETSGAKWVFSGNSTKIVINSGSINCTGFSNSYGLEVWRKNDQVIKYTTWSYAPEHAPVIASNICEINDIGTSSKYTWSSDKISEEISKLFNQLSPLTNLIDGKVWEEAFLDSSGQEVWMNDFIHTNIPVTPGQTIYLCNAVSQLNCAFLASDGETIVKYVSVATDDHGKYIVPSDAGIAYMSIPCRAGYAKNYIVAEEDIAFNGNVPEIYRGTPGYAPSLVDVTTGETRPDVLRFQVEKFDGSASSTKYTFANCQDMIMNRLCGFVMLGYTSDYEVYCFSPTNGTIYKFNATTAANSVGTVQGLSFPSAIQNMTIYSSTGAGQRYTTANINPWRITFTQNSYLVRDLEGNTITEVPYSDIDAILPTGKKMANLNKVIGTCYYINNNVYPSNAAYVSWRSTIPCSTSKIVVEKDTDATTWSRKEWFAYGTSMTADNNGYAPNLRDLSGMILHNYGLGGSGIIPSLHSSDNVKTRCMRTTDGKANADLVTVEIIPNDMSGDLGTPTDTSDSTFLGNLNQIIAYLLENCPHAQVVILTSTRSRRSLDGATEYDPQSEQAGKWLTWEDGIKEVCRRNGIQFWSGNDNSGLGYHRVKYSASGNTYVEDNIHLTDVGGKNLARYFFSKLKELPLWYLPN